VLDTKSIIGKNGGPRRRRDTADPKNKQKNNASTVKNYNARNA
jgi:hypothetical protein